MIWQVACGVEWQGTRVLDDFEIVALAGFVEVGDAAFNFGYV